MKKRLTVKYVILILIAMSFLSVLYCINSSKIAILEKDENDYNTDASFLENPLSLGTSNEIFWTFLIENGPETKINCSIEEFLEKSEDFFFTFFVGTTVSLDFLILLKSFLKDEKLRRIGSQEIKEVNLTDRETKIFRLIQEFLTGNKIFNKEKVAMFIKSRFNANGNLNYNGILGVLDSLLKKKLVYEGSKLTIKTLFLNNNRLQIFNLIKDNPGIYKNKMIKELNSSSFVVNWHLSILKKFQLIRERNIDGQLSYFKYSKSSLNDKFCHVMLKDKCQEIVEYLRLNNKGCTKYRIAKELKMHYNTITKYLDKLEEFNLLIRKKKTNSNLLFLNVPNFEKVLNIV